MDMRAENKMCSFCGNQGSSDNPLCGGLGAMICFDCVGNFHDANSSPERIAAESRPPWDDMSDTEVLSSLTLITRSAEQNTAFAREWVEMLRARGISWARIGQALAVSRQAAWERFSKPVDGSRSEEPRSDGSRTA